MKRNNSPQDMHLELLEKFCVFLSSNGFYVRDHDRVYYEEDVYLGYRDEGPDAWASSQWFSGPAWIWDESRGWRFFENGVTITGYDGLSATLLYIEDDTLHVTHVYGVEY